MNFILKKIKLKENPEILRKWKYTMVINLFENPNKENKFGLKTGNCEPRVSKMKRKEMTSSRGTLLFSEYKRANVRGLKF